MTNLFNMDFGKMLMVMLVTYQLCLVDICASEENAVKDPDAGADKVDEQTAMNKVISQVPVEELVDLICECRVEDACKARSRPRDCYDIQQAGNTESGLYDIYPAYVEGVLQVYCDLTTDNGGWTVFQRREDGLVDFFLDWESYKQGFGYAGSEHWLGNENIFAISNQDDYELRVDLEDFDSEKRFAHYSHFRIGDEGTKYELAIRGYDGDAGDSLLLHDGYAFSTKDQDNDIYGPNCAVNYNGAWWYSNCHYSNLNGQYLDGDTNAAAKGVVWKAFRGHGQSLKRTEMKIRPKKTN